MEMTARMPGKQEVIVETSRSTLTENCSTAVRVKACYGNISPTTQIVEGVDVTAVVSSHPTSLYTVCWAPNIASTTTHSCGCPCGWIFKLFTHRNVPIASK
jgi:hypothetical protein